jgi:hypothetical protein
LAKGGRGILVTRAIQQWSQHRNNYHETYQGIAVLDLD